MRNQNDFVFEPSHWNIDDRPETNEELKKVLLSFFKYAEDYKAGKYPKVPVRPASKRYPEAFGEQK
jgi:hypothetical protein